MLHLKLWKENSSIHTDITLTPKLANLIVAGISFCGLFIRNHELHIF